MSYFSVQTIKISNLIIDLISEIYTKKMLKEVVSDNYNAYFLQ